MRTTLDIDEDVLEAAKELAAVHRKTAGKVLSELAR
ncbi:MAG TPA: antitoxin, partial [Thermoanaerobaculia bacterium]|nr:antitoxin [Thermoanaerobaculia bacterium]